MRPVLILHISVGLIELLGLYLQPMFLRHERIPNLLDLVLCLAQSGTNMALVKRMARGQWRMTRPSYQAGAIMRPVLTISAIVFQRSDLHAASLQIIHAFIYTRCLIYIWWKAKLLDRHSDTYMVAVFSAAILAMADTACPGILSKTYVLCVAGISSLNHWTSRQIAEPPTRRSASKAHLLGLLLRLGLVDLESLREREISNTMKDDCYCDNFVAERTKGGSSTGVQETTAQATLALETDTIWNQTDTMSVLSAIETASPNGPCLSPCVSTEDPISESHEVFAHSQMATSEGSPLVSKDHLPMCPVSSSGNTLVETQNIQLSMDGVTRVNGIPRTKRWRSVLSLRGISTSIALRDTEDGLKTFKLGTRVLVNEIKASEDDPPSKAVAHQSKQNKSKRVLMYKMLGKLKKQHAEGKI